VQFIISDWRACLALLGGVALLVAAYRGHLFTLDFWNGRAETRAPPDKMKKAKRR
jgi:hypothetical protein